MNWWGIFYCRCLEYYWWFLMLEVSVSIKKPFFFFSFPVTLNNLIDSLVNWKWHISKWFSDFYCLPLSTPTSEMFCLYFSWKYSHHKVSKKRKPRSNTTFLENSSFFFFLIRLWEEQSKKHHLHPLKYYSWMKSHVNSLSVCRICGWLGNKLSWKVTQHRCPP